MNEKQERSEEVELGWRWYKFLIHVALPITIGFNLIPAIIFGMQLFDGQLSNILYLFSGTVIYIIFYSIFLYGLKKFKYWTTRLLIVYYILPHISNLLFFYGIGWGRGIKLLDIILDIIVTVCEIIYFHKRRKYFVNK